MRVVALGSTVISSEDVNNEIADPLKPVAWLAAGMRAQGMLGCVLQLSSLGCVNEGRIKLVRVNIVSQQMSTLATGA